MVDLKIENVIAELEFEDDLDLKKIAESLNGAEYNPDHFPGLLYKLKSPKSLTLMFSRGYSVCTGAQSLENAKAALKIIYKKLKDQSLIDAEKMPTINIQNIIVSYKFKDTLDLEAISKKLPKTNSEIEYDPKKFPGLKYHDNATDINVLLFNTGVIVGYGTHLLIELEQLLGELEEYYT